MKLMRVFGGFLFGLGCVVVLIGLLAQLMPMVDNDQLKLVLASFKTPSDNPVVSAVNAIMTYSLRNCYLVMLIGAGVLLFGMVLMLFGKGTKPAEDVAPVASDEAAAYTVAASDADAVNIPLWKQSGKPPKRANPYADASVAGMLAPNTAGGAAATTTNPFIQTSAPSAKPTSAYQRPVDSERTHNKKHKKAASNEEAASDAGNAEHLFDLIRRYGAGKDGGADEGGITVSLTSAEGTGEQGAAIRLVLDEDGATPEVAAESEPPASPPRPDIAAPVTAAYAPPEPIPDAPTATVADASSEAPQPSPTYGVATAPSPRQAAYPASYTPGEAPSHPTDGEAAGQRRALGGQSKAGPMHIPEPMLTPAAQRSEETIYRSPSYKPTGDGRPRIRSTFNTGGTGIRATVPRPAASAPPRQADGSSSRIRITVGKRD